MQVKIIADSTCDLPEEIIEQLDIDIVPLYVIMDDVSYRDRLEMTPEKLIEWSDETKKTPMTSAPSVEDYIKAFGPYVEKKRDVVFISISSELSATCQNAHFAVNSLDKGNIKVIDSRNVSIGTGFSVIMAAKLARQGKSVEEIANELEKCIPYIQSSFVFDNLEFLKRGGRCSSAKSLAASALRLRPRIDAIEGSLVPVEKFRGSLKKSVSKFVESVLKDLENADPELCFIGTTKDEHGLLHIIREEIEQKGYFNEILTTNAGCIITSHSGPNTYGIVFKKEK